LVGEERGFVHSVIKRKKNWIGHGVLGNSLLKIVVERRMVDKKLKERSRMGMIDDLKEGCYAEMKRGNEYREKLR
jgi:hypothetical protein